MPGGNGGHPCTVHWQDPAHPDQTGNPCLWGTHVVPNLNCDVTDPDFWLKRRIMLHLQQTTNGVQVNDAVADQLAEQCIGYARGAGLAADRCATDPVFMPGGDVPMPAEVDLNSLTKGAYTKSFNAVTGSGGSPHPEFFVLHRRAQPLRTSWRPVDSRCPDGAAQIPVDGVPVNCDEYPYRSVLEGGNIDTVSLRMVSAAQNGLEGTRLAQFYGPSACNVANSDVASDANEFIVLPIVLSSAQPQVTTPTYAPATTWACRQ